MSIYTVDVYSATKSVRKMPLAAPHMVRKTPILNEIRPKERQIPLETLSIWNLTQDPNEPPTGKKLMDWKTDFFFLPLSGFPPLSASAVPGVCTGGGAI